MSDGHYSQDCVFIAISVDQILTHWFATMLLALRHAFREAKDCIVLGKFTNADILRSY